MIEGIPSDAKEFKQGSPARYASLDAVNTNTVCPCRNRFPAYENYPGWHLPMEKYLPGFDRLRGQAQLFRAILQWRRFEARLQPQKPLVQRDDFVHAQSCRR